MNNRNSVNIDWNSKPDAINDVKTEWWLLHEETEYMKSLLDTKVWAIRLHTGTRYFVITDGPEVIYETQQPDGLQLYMKILRDL